MAPSEKWTELEALAIAICKAVDNTTHPTRLRFGRVLDVLNSSSLTSRAEAAEAALAEARGKAVPSPEDCTP